MISAERLAEIEQLTDAASGPWEIADTTWHHDGTFMATSITEGPFDLISCYGGGEESSKEREATAEADAAFIVAARIAVPELLAEVRRLQQQVEQLERRGKCPCCGQLNGCCVCWSTSRSGYRGPDGEYVPPRSDHCTPERHGRRDY